MVSDIKSTESTVWIFNDLDKALIDMKYFLFLFLFISVTVYAQFTKSDEQLAATTYTREFNKAIITGYLNSSDDKKVVAGLLSISQSEDTSFVPLITSLPLNKFAEEICFSLGQIGYCYTSTGYLKNIFNNSGNDPLTRYYSLVALGKIADSTFAESLISDYTDSQSKSGFNGISLALYYLFTEGKISADKVRPVLENELYFSSSRQFEAAFCLYRINPSPNEKKLLINVLERILGGKIVSPVTVKPVSYILGCLRKLEYFPYDLNLIKELVSVNDFQVQVEFIKALSYCKFESEDGINSFLEYLDNDNKNLSRQAAESVKNLKLHSTLGDYLFLKLSERLHNDTEMEKYTRGELLISYLTLFPDDFNDILLKFFNGSIAPEYVFKICSFYPESEEALKILGEKYYTESLPNKLSIIESILNFSQTIPQVGDVLLSAISSNHPPLISMAAEGIDSSFISAHKDTLTGIITGKISAHLNDADYIESLISLESAAAKISADLKQAVINYLSKSELYSIRKFTAGLQGHSTLTISKNIGDFDKYWNRAFEYSKAEIITEQGSFTISFLPEYAPVTVGSFCYLAEKNFFNQIPFHRVVPGFVIQGGDPSGTGWGGPDYEIVSEFSPFDYSSGIVGMASAGKDTEGSQWFITTGNYPHLDGRYTIFAEVLKGLQVVDQVTQGTKILRVNLIR